MNFNNKFDFDEAHRNICKNHNFYNNAVKSSNIIMYRCRSCGSEYSPAQHFYSSVTGSEDLEFQGYVPDKEV